MRSAEGEIGEMLREFQESYEAFREHGVEDPLFETLRLFDIASGGALSNIDATFFDPHNLNLAQVAQQRKEGVPMEYILGSAPFASLLFRCSKDTIVPTSWTELLVWVCLDIIKTRQQYEKKQTIIEVGTGCGNIAVTLALRTDGVNIMASDISPRAVEIAQKNVDRFNVNDKVTLSCGDLFSPFHEGHKGGIDLIVCNPPYIPTTSLGKLSPEVIDHQPKIALDAGPYGIDFFRKLIAGSIPMLKSGGLLVFEIGVGQENLVTRILTKNGGYGDIGYFEDKESQIRVISATKTPR